MLDSKNWFQFILGKITTFSQNSALFNAATGWIGGCLNENYPSMWLRTFLDWYGCHVRAKWLVSISVWLESAKSPASSNNPRPGSPPAGQYTATPQLLCSPAVIKHVTWREGDGIAAAHGYGHRSPKKGYDFSSRCISPVAKQICHESNYLSIAIRWWIMYVHAMSHIQTWKGKICHVY